MKERLAILFAGVKGIVQCVYWIFVFITVTRHMGDFGGPIWTSCCGGSLFPWPVAPGGLAMIIRANLIDSFIYYLVVSLMFIPVAIVVITVAGYIGWRIGERLEKRKGKT